MSDDPDRRVEYELFLRRFMLVGPPKEVIRQLTQSFEPITIAPGGLIFEKGDAPRNLYFIMDGEVDLTGDDDHFSFRRGDLVGVVDASARRPHLRRAVARTEAHLLALPFADWLDALEDHPEFSNRLRRIFADTLHSDRLLLGASGGFAVPPPDDGLGLLADSVLTKLLTLREVPAFSSASVQSLTELAEKARTIHAAPGELVFPPGAAVEKVLVVMSGEVHVERRIAPEISARFGRNQLVLDGAGLGGALAEYALTARRESALIVLESTDIDDVAEDHFDVFASILRSITLEREAIRVTLHHRTSAPPQLRGG